MGGKINKSINEILSELNELAHSTGEREECIDTFENSNSLEQAKAEEYYEALRNSFEGFETKTSTPNKESENLATGKHQGSQV